MFLSLIRANVSDIDTYEGKRFRAKFRVPFAIFQHIVDICNRDNVFEVKSIKRVKIPVNMKVPMSLGILGGGNCADDIGEFANVGNSTVHQVFKLFCRNFRNSMESVHLAIPTLEEMDAIMKVYDTLGLPGTIGSVYLSCPLILSTSVTHHISTNTTSNSKN